MYAFTFLTLAAAIGATHAQETVLGAYIFSRHGDRTSKSTPPANLTDLGYREIYTSGQYYRDRYVSSGASNKIQGLNTDLVKLSQITVSAPSDNVLISSAIGFLQGLYPPVGTTLSTETLHNGTQVQAPLNGYQLIPVAVTSSTTSEDSAWLQGSSNCANALISSNSYFASAEYLALLNSTHEFYTSLAPMINSTFATSAMSFKNAYTIFDYLNVASINNGTFPSEELLTDEVLYQLRTLADAHEWGLAYNSSEPIRAISGSTLAAQVVSALNTTITGKGKSKLNIQFGTYSSFASYFGLADLISVNSDFYGVTDYASSMVWELLTNSTSSTFPNASDISVRFLFHNGTTSNTSEPVAYPLFGGSETIIPWTDFVTATEKFAISDQADWCTACGNTTGVCASSTSTSSSSASSSSSTTSSSSPTSSPSSGMSKAVAGVIGAFVTLAVILGLELVALLIGGFRIVSKKRLGAASPVTGSTDASQGVKA